MITRINNYYILENQAEYLHSRLAGHVIENISSFEKNKVHIVCSETLLEFSIENDFTYLVLRENFSLPSKNIVNILKECEGKRINEIKLVNEDRLIGIFFDNNSYLLLNFVNHKQNCFYIENDFIKNAYKNSKELAGLNASSLFEKTSNENEFSKYGKDVFNVIPDAKKIEELYSAPKYLLYKSPEKIVASFFEIDNLDGYEKLEYENTNELLKNWIKYRTKDKNIGDAKKDILEVHNRKLKQLDKNIHSFETQLKNINESDKYKVYGDTIMANIWKIKKGDVVFESESEDGTEMISVKLKETLSPQENAKNYFEKYKKQKGSGGLIEKKLENVRKERIALAEEIEKIKNNEDYKILKKQVVKEEKNKNDETNKFRKFKVDEELEVWVGKDSASNDLLTMKHSAQNDLWFHVRGFSGSHTVLKTGNRKEIDKKLILMAASISAYYSKARNGGNVPVAYTERKYVKKMKGFKEGSVMLEKEKVIFVKPGLPEGLKDI